MQEQSKELMENLLTEEELEKRGIEKVAEDEVFKHIYTSVSYTHLTLPTT